MEENVETPVEETDDIEALMRELLGDDVDEEEELVEEVEQKYEKEDKATEKKLKKVAKVLVDHLAEEKSIKAYNDAIAGMTELERELAGATLKPDDDPAVIAKKVGLVKAQATKMMEIIEAKAAAAGEEAEEAAAQAWGIPRTGAAPPSDEAQKELDARIAAGDMDALFKSVVMDDFPHA